MGYKHHEMCATSSSTRDDIIEDLSSTQVTISQLSPNAESSYLPTQEASFQHQNLPPPYEQLPLRVPQQE
ncbi:hypothetical protein TMatcc_001192 [Talaromyces marneffei ATCC 18224]